MSSDQSEPQSPSATLSLIDWPSLLHRLWSISPTAQAARSSIESEASIQRLQSSLSALLAKTTEDLPSEQSLLIALSSALARSEFAEALKGDQSAQYRVISMVTQDYLEATPWGSLSEREVAILLTRWFEELGSGGGLSEEIWWGGLPSVSCSRWVEVGLKAQLAEALDSLQVGAQVQEGHAGHPRAVGVRVVGSGCSSHLAWACRWGRSRGLEMCNASELTPQRWVDERSPLLIYVDALQRASRRVRWGLASALNSRGMRSARPLLIVWSDDGSEYDLAASLDQELDEVLTCDLNEHWLKREVLVEDVPRWLGQRQPELTVTDQLRLCDLITSPPAIKPELKVSDLEAFAALIGPLTPLSVLGEVMDMNEEGLRELLLSAGWSEQDVCERGGGRMSPPSALHWRSALIEGGRRAHACARQLIEAYETRYRGSLTPDHLTTLNRLSVLRGRPSYRGMISLPPDPDEAWERTKELASCLAHEAPSPFVLATLCGLARDWARLGPLSGRWSEALQALELGVAAAKRAQDLMGAALLLSELGSLALSDGRASVAEQALQTSLTLLRAGRHGEKATQTAQQLAEVSLLNGDVVTFLTRCAQAEVIAHELSLDREAWRSRFRLGQLWAQLGEHQRALACWSTLGSGQEEKRGRGQALNALALECASSELYLGRSAEARHFLDQVEVEIPLKIALEAICDWHEKHTDPLTSLAIAIERAQQKREIGTWLALHRMRAHFVVEHGQDLIDQNDQLLNAIRADLETAIRVAVGARDRLTLVNLYQLLSMYYKALGLMDAAQGAAAMHLSWSRALQLPEPVLAEGKGKWMVDPSVKITEEIIQEAQREVDQLLSTWREIPMSTSLQNV